MVKVIGSYGGYRKTSAYAFACLVYHATCAFCRRNYNYQNDSLGKTTGQMVGAARSARQNIVEGSVRAGTSKETELRLYDVAKGSLEELAGDYEAFLLENDTMPWPDDAPQSKAVKGLHLDAFEYGSPENVRHDYGKYLLAMRQRFAPWLEAEDAVLAANANLLVIEQICRLLHRMMEQISSTFCQEGGFTERMSKARLEQRGQQILQQDSPACPICGKPMRKVIARKGRNAGHPFWSCVDYPNCTGSLPCNDTP